MIKIEHVEKTYDNGILSCSVLHDVTLNIGDSEIVSITGASGSGKSTLLNVISSLDKPTSGKVFFNDMELSALSESECASLRLNSFGFIFQDFYLVSTLNVHENIIFPAHYKSGTYDKQFYDEIVSECGLKNKLLNFPHELSGGEQQRVAVCRALLSHPDVIFADEPTGNLDSVNANAVFQLLISYAKKCKCSLVYVTHEEHFAQLADYRIFVSDGICSKQKTHQIEEGK